jgi:hypothetical protein
MDSEPASQSERLPSLTHVPHKRCAFQETLGGILHHWLLEQGVQQYRLQQEEQSYRAVRSQLTVAQMRVMVQWCQAESCMRRTLTYVSAGVSVLILSMSTRLETSTSRVGHLAGSKTRRCCVPIRGSVQSVHRPSDVLFVLTTQVISLLICWYSC